jgi:hypothetical protein
MDGMIVWKQDVDWIVQAQDRNQWWAFVSMANKSKEFLDQLCKTEISRDPVPWSHIRILN